MFHCLRVSRIGSSQWGICEISDETIPLFVTPLNPNRTGHCLLSGEAGIFEIVCVGHFGEFNYNHFLSFPAMEEHDFDVDFFKFHVELSFLVTQIQWVLSSHYIRVSFDVSGLFMIASSPCLLFLEAGQQENLLASLRERFDGIRPHAKASLFLQQPRTISGWDLADLLNRQGISVRFSFIPPMFV